MAMALVTSALCHAFNVTNLRVEYTSHPLGLDVATPRFSWQMDSKTRGAAQTAYAITVSDASGNEVWNSGRVASSASVGIHYGGKALQPSTRYTWTVTVYGNGKTPEVESATSWFETGLMTTSDKAAAWGGAKWIGANDVYSFYSQYLPVFRLNFTVSLDKKTKSREAALLYGANDLRLMDKNKNILGMPNAKDASYIKVVLNIAPLLKGDSATVDVYRVGYTQRDRADIPFDSKKISTAVINKANCYAPHTLTLTSVCGTTNISVDGDNAVITGLNLNPMGKGGDYIAFPVVGDMGFSVPAGQKATVSADVQNYRLPRHTIAQVADGLTVSGQTVFLTPKAQGTPLLRTEFATNGKAIASARLYATARGVYDMFINGQRVSNDYLNPGLTQYNKTLFYQTYDVTSLLRDGRNAIGAQLNEGWWSGFITFTPENWNYFGDRQSLLAQLVITYDDGSQERIVTDPATWRYTAEGPVRLASIFQGEVYDATREAAVADFSQPGFDASKWQQADEMPLEGVISHEKPTGFFAWPTTDDYSHFTLVSQIGQPVRPFTTLTAQTVKEVRPGVYVYDMGQNMAGVPDITFSGLQPGTKVYMRYAEVTYPDLPEYKNNVGMVMMENQRAAMEQDIYVAKGGTETFHPRYTYHGYRYVEITGIPAALPASAVKGVVLSSVDSLTAGYETNNKDVNRFFKNVQWSTLANVFSVPTDCPQRNERMGWSGDLSVFSPTMSYMFQGAEFLNRHLLALRDVQLADGNYTAIAPIGGGFGGPLWASVGITMPWQSYQQYGDVDALAAHYPSMKRFIQLHTTKYIDKAQGFFNFTDGIGLGDWLGFEVNKNDNSLLFDCYLVHELDIMIKAARALGKIDDVAAYTALRKQRADFINAHYIDTATGLTTGSGLGKEVKNPFGGVDGPKRKGVLIDTQTSYALPIAFNIIDPAVKDKFVSRFVNSVERQSTGDDGKTYPAYSLMTGFIGTAWISQALSEAGHSDVAYRMLLNTNFPSWLYPVEQGATTIWERLNSYTKKDGFGGNNSMNSFNHYAFGSVTNWLMQHSLGIARDEAAPAFKHFFLQPEPDVTGGLTEARGHYDSMYGRIESCWHNTPQGLVYRCTVPANTSATLLLPVTTDAKGRVVEKVLLDGKPLAKSKKTVVNGKLSIELPAGEYEVEIAK